MLGEIKRGDRLRVTLLDCYVESVTRTSRGYFLYLNFRDQGSSLNVGPIPLAADLLKVEALTPHSWPPLEGDVWEDGQGTKWFGVRQTDQSEVTLFSAQGMYAPDGPDDLLRTKAPWRRVYRDETAPPF
ncbi:hypothetical protein [Nonomuraea endophytica]|uniref:hypothetical protein n=1 Tax=Nonomuraea endophytica TaxID=714136 RepID=UPI0037C5B8FA